MNKFYNAFRRKMMLTCAVALFLIIVSVHFTMYFSIRKIITDQIALSAQSTATAIAGSIMEDIDGYRLFLSTRDEQSAYYQRMQAYFSKIKSSGTNIKFIYTERPLDDATVEFILDAEPIGSPDHSAPGDTTFMDDASRRVYATKLPARLPPTVHEQYGVLLGGSSPILDQEGELLGLVGVNLDISEMYKQLNRFQIIMLVLYLFILTVCLMVLSKYSNLILEPMVKDKLTGAYSKRYFETLLRMEMKNAARDGSDLAVLMLDLDHFKKVNDTYGHGFGDTVLTTVAKTVMNCLRANDSFIRYGGEEFAVIIPKVCLETVLKIAERIRAAVENIEIYNEEHNLSIKITISIGVSHIRGHGRAEQQIVEKADKALYEAKVTRNAVSLFQEEPEEEL